MDQTRQNRAAEVQPQHNEQKRLIVFLIAAAPVAEIDLVGPLSVFRAANFILQEQNRQPIYQLEIATAENGDDLVAGDCGLSLLTTKPLASLTGKIDTLLIAGGTGSLTVTAESAAVMWLHSEINQIRRVGAVCTGAFVLAAAGLLDERRATTHWRYCRRLARQYPRVRVEEAPIFVCDNGVYTSAGITAGMDLALELVAADCGAETARAAARDLVMFLRRPGGQAQFSVALQTQTPERADLRELQIWILAHLNKPLTVNRLAAQAAMSERHFARVFAREFGVTPARYVLQQRVEAARRDLESSRRGSGEIAVRCGLGSAVNLRRVFLRELGSTPESYRRHFADERR